MDRLRRAENNIKSLNNRLRTVEKAYIELAKVVHDANGVIKNLLIALNVLIRKAGITNDEIQALIDGSKADLDRRELQSKDTGADESGS